jgi:malate permease and related proteins
MLSSFLSIIMQVFIPISLPMISGVLLKRYLGLDTKPLAILALYVLSPALLFETLSTAELTFGDIYKTGLFSVLNLVVLWGIAQGSGKMFGLPAAERAGLTLVSIFTNCVNYGLPLVLLAFGKLGMDKASVYVIGQMIIVNTLGVFLAARSHFTIKQAVRSVFALPAIYAALLAIAVRMMNLPLHAGIEKGITMLSSAYAPVVLALLGSQMVLVRGTQKQELPKYRKALLTGIVLRLLLSPLIAAALLTLLSIDGTLFAVLLILSSMPAAVNAVLLSERFDAAPQFVSRCILWTTLASFISLPLIIAAVQR